MIQAGKLNKRVTLRMPTDSRDATYGSVTQSWADVATVWAAIEPMTGREYNAAQMRADDTSVKVTMRKRDDFGVKGRVVYGSRVFEPVSVVDPLERGESMVCVCKEISSNV